MVGDLSLLDEEELNVPICKIVIFENSALIKSQVKPMNKWVM
jgi:hypothetical protein